MLSEEQDNSLDSCFYDDDVGHWIITGDRAVMDEDGACHIVGRYKDLIIRGGENIAPKAIESYLQDLGITAEIVGVPDEISEEMPVAIVKPAPGQDINFTEVRRKVGEELGSAFAPEEMINLEDLGGAEDFPRTGTGKVRKNILRDEVITYMQSQEETDHVGTTSDIDVKTLTKLWTKLLGVNTLDPQTSVRDFADSLVLSRFSAKLRRATGQSLTLQQLLDNPTIEAQAKLLSSSASPAIKENEYSDMLELHDGPPSLQHVAPAWNDEDIFEKIKARTEEILRPSDLSWEDVEDIVPMHDTMEVSLHTKIMANTVHSLSSLPSIVPAYYS